RRHRRVVRRRQRGRRVRGADRAGRFRRPRRARRPRRRRRCGGGAHADGGAGSGAGGPAARPEHRRPFRGRRGSDGRAPSHRHRRAHPHAHRGGAGSPLRYGGRAPEPRRGRLGRPRPTRARERAGTPAAPLRRAARCAVAGHPRTGPRARRGDGVARAARRAQPDDPRHRGARGDRGAHPPARRDRETQPIPPSLMKPPDSPETPAATDELPRSFEPAPIEARWYPIWESRGYFANKPAPQLPLEGDARASASASAAGEPHYCIQLPPPNVTGTLHMGHAFQQTLMDTLIRYHRMKGADTNWVVGTDHAGIATQIVVERQLQAEGKSRHDLGREAFVARVWDWKQESGATITRQMRRLGDSANWAYADTEGQNAGYFTMDAKMSRAVVEVF